MWLCRWGKAGKHCIAFRGACLQMASITAVNSVTGQAIQVCFYLPIVPGALSKVGKIKANRLKFGVNMPV